MDTESAWGVAHEYVMPGADALFAVAPQSLPSVGHEQEVVVRYWGRVQQRVSAVLCQNARELEHWQTEVVRLRGQLLVMRTALLWGMAGSVLPFSKTGGRRVMQTPPWPEARQVICQTGCVGHAHVWRAEDGQCQRTGQLCDTQVSQGATAVPKGERSQS